MSGNRLLGLMLPWASRGGPLEHRVGRARLDRPAIVDVHVHVAVIDHAGGNHRVGRVAHDLVGHAVVPDVPTVPAHVRRQGQRVAADDLELPLGLAQGVLGAERDHVLAAIR